MQNFDAVANTSSVSLYSEEGYFMTTDGACQKKIYPADVMQPGFYKLRYDYFNANRNIIHGEAVLYRYIFEDCTK